MLASWLQVTLITLIYSDIADLHTFQFTAAHAVGFQVFTSRLPATDLNTETRTSNHYEVLLFRSSDVSKILCDGCSMHNGS
jgi:hypothetical protein